MRKTLFTTTVISSLGIGALLSFRTVVARIVFGSSDADELVVYTVATLVAVIAYNIGGNLLTALRQVRANSGVQFVNSLIFSIVAIVLLGTTALGAKAVLVSYLIACVVTTAGSVILIRSAISPLPKNEPKLTSRSVWTKLGPYIGWFWLSDFLLNLFNWTDRLMIVHCAGLDLESATAMIGQYHSSRIIGVLLISLVGMLGSVLLSYLSHDWEAGRRESAEARLSFALRLVGVAMTAIAVGTLIFAPVIFGWMLKGEFEAGFEVLHITLAYCIWYGLLTMAANYIWCHERPGACLRRRDRWNHRQYFAELSFAPSLGLGGRRHGDRICQPLDIGLYLPNLPSIGIRNAPRHSRRTFVAGMLVPRRASRSCMLNRRCLAWNIDRLDV